MQRYYIKLKCLFLRANIFKMNKEDKLKLFNDMRKKTLMETLEIEYVDVGDDYVVATMPVTEKVHQPDGILNGGATLALAECVGSPASLLAADPTKFHIRGIQMSANHIRSIKSGYVKATTKFLHKGRTTHVLEITITDPEDRLISICKLTNIILPK